MNIKWLWNNLDKAFWLIYLPFAFPSKFFQLMGISFSNPRLIGELIHLYPRRKWLKSKHFSTLIDVGSFIGSYSYAMSLILPGIKIIAFEPLKDNYLDLNRNMAGHENFTAFHIALGSQSGEVNFNSNRFPAASSVLELEDLHKAQYPYAATVSKTTAPLGKLDASISDVEIEGPALLKIDVQGFELEVLKGAAGCLEKIDSVYLEVSYQPLYANQCSFDSIHHFLSEHGFEFMGSYNQTYTRDGTVLQSDILYCKPKQQSPVS